MTDFIDPVFCGFELALHFASALYVTEKVYTMPGVMKWLFPRGSACHIL